MGGIFLEINWNKKQLGVSSQLYCQVIYNFESELIYLYS